MDRLNIIPKDNIINVIINVIYLNKTFKEPDIKRYLYILNKNYFNERLKYILYNYLNYHNTSLNSFLFEEFINKNIIDNEDMPYTSIDEDIIINKLITYYKNNYKY